MLLNLWDASGPGSKDCTVQKEYTCKTNPLLVQFSTCSVRERFQRLALG